MRANVRLRDRQPCRLQRQLDLAVMIAVVEDQELDELDRVREVPIEEPAVANAPQNQAIMANDNASYWKGTLGYPAIAFLLTKGVLQYRADIAILLKGIAWKDINQRYRNDFEKTLRHIQNSLERSEWGNLSEYTESLSKAIDTLDLNHLGKQKMPPQGY